MFAAAFLLLVTTWAPPGTPEGPTPTEGVPGINLEAAIEPHAMVIRATLEGPPPGWLVEEVRERRPVSIEYQIRLRALRKAWWDRRVWRGTLVTRTAFDPVTGRHRCEAVLDGAIVASGDLETVAGALDWLVRPPEIRIVVPEDRDPTSLRIRVRAVFSTSTVWLVFPRSEGTDWTERSLVPELAGAGPETDD